MICVCGCLQIFRDYLTFAGIGLSKAQMFESVLEELNQSHVCHLHKSVYTVVCRRRRRGRGHVLPPPQKKNGKSENILGQFTAIIIYNLEILLIFIH